MMIPVILSGGSGTRLWPFSRQNAPKQFVNLFEESLFSQTLNRVKPFGSPWSVTVSSMKVLTEREFKAHGIALDQIVYEPFGKNTAPALALLCKTLSLKGKANEVVGVFPADHLIRKSDVFRRALKLATECASEGQVVTLGVLPTYPSTGYGYIEVKSDTFKREVATDNGLPLSALRVEGFREKPSEERAEQFVKSGNYFWNAGIFIFSVSTLISAFKEWMPDLWKTIDLLAPDQKNLKDIYESVTPQSIDYGIMEHITNQVCIPCDLGWSDVGSWDEVAALSVGTDALEEQAEKNFVRGIPNKSYAFIGTENLIVVDTPDACLIAKKGTTQKVKDVVDKLKEKKITAAVEHTYDIRPWGQFEVLRDTEHFKSKVITVLPGQQLSYQSHKKRAEHWVITRGVSEVVLNDVVHNLKAGESIYIPIEAKHRIRNPSKTQVLEFVEVQVGSYFGEDDITRYSDDYGR